MTILEKKWGCLHFCYEQVVSTLLVHDKLLNLLEMERYLMDLFAFSGKKDSLQNEKFMRGCRFLEAELQEMDRVLAGRYVLV